MAGWYVLIHQLPPDPPYLRAKIANRLARIGALALKNAVYVLPRRDSCLEDLQWIAEEATASGGTAYIAAADWIAGVTDDDLRQRFAEARAADYQALAAEIRQELATRNHGTGGRPAQLRQRLAEIAAVDWFDAPEREQAEELLNQLESGTGRVAGGRPAQAAAAELRGMTWITRPDVYVDRIATAWLVRRFVDPKARFRFTAASERRRRRAGEITFDVAGGDLTHEGERCTFQVLLDRLGLKDAALRTIGEIVADIDFKESRHGHPETAGIGRLLSGLAARHARDRDRIERGAELFDALYAALRAAAPARPRRERKR
ncbi:MAG TPA: chromate resistance protein ChrB domain-containing protein [Thermoanaerobaculia bacterium]